MVTYKTAQKISAQKCVQNKKFPAKSLRKMLELAGGHVIA